MAKITISATIDPEILQAAETLVETRAYRNLSHVVENALLLLIQTHQAK